MATTRETVDHTTLARLLVRECNAEQSNERAGDQAQSATRENESGQKEVTDSEQARAAQIEKLLQQMNERRAAALRAHRRGRPRAGTVAATARGLWRGGSSYRSIDSCNRASCAIALISWPSCVRPSSWATSDRMNSRSETGNKTLILARRGLI
jgi:hypothetical protein